MLNLKRHTGVQISITSSCLQLPSFPYTLLFSHTPSSLLPFIASSTSFFHNFRGTVQTLIVSCVHNILDVYLVRVSFSTRICLFISSLVASSLRVSLSAPPVVLLRYRRDYFCLLCLLFKSLLHTLHFA